MSSSSRLILPTQLSTSTKLGAVIWRDLTAWRAYCFALFLAVCFVAYFFPLSFLAGHSAVFDHGDNAQHVSGWWYYAVDSWHFPLLHTERVDHPDGLNIAFTDSIPLAALFFKLFRSWLPAHFHYFGIWVGLVFVTMAISATMLTRALGAKSLIATIIAVLFALTWPLIHTRYSHAALMMQSIIVFGLAFYFMGRSKAWGSNSTAWAFIGLNVVALTVHPYFLPFTAGLFVAFLLDQALKSETWLKQIMRLIAYIAVLGAIAWVLGYFGHNTYRGGYGDPFQFNLLSPFCGGGRVITCDINVAPIVRFEGFNYFGAGLLMLLPFALLLNWRQLIAVPKQYPALLLVLLGCFLYAVSNHVWAGDREWFTFALPSWLHWLTGTYRVAGRFFWIIGYLVLFATLATLAKRKTWFVLGLLLVAIVVQVKDVNPLLKNIKTLAAKPSKLDFEAWTPVMKQVDKVVIYPTFDCGPGDLQYYTWIMQLAGYHGKLLNSGYTSRDNKDCKASEKEILEPFKPRHMYVISSASYFGTPFTPDFTFPKPFLDAVTRGECVKLSDGMMCLPGVDPKIWQSISLVAAPVKLLSNGRIWLGSELSTLIGKITGQGLDQRLVPKDAKTPGWLSFGPFAHLPAGRYRFLMQYASEAPSSQHVGNLDVVFHGNMTPSETQVYAAKLMGTEGRKGLAEGFITLAPADAFKPLEIRSYFLAQGDLQILSITIEKAP